MSETMKKVKSACIKYVIGYTNFIGKTSVQDFMYAVVPVLLIGLVLVLLSFLPYVGFWAWAYRIINILPMVTVCVRCVRGLLSKD